MKQVKLTTTDNPFDPFEDFENWFLFDNEKGYGSCSRLMRIAQLNDDFSEVEINDELERAIDALIMYDFTDTYKKVSKNYPDLEEPISEEYIDDL
jgi:hypothetical protein